METTITDLHLDTFKFLQRGPGGDVVLGGKTGWDRERGLYWAQVEGQERVYAENTMYAALDALTEWYYPGSLEERRSKCQQSKS